MFNQTITQTPLTTGMASSFFSHISGSSFRNDVSFLSTLRALLHSRLSPDEHVDLVFTESAHSEDRIAAKPAASWVREISLNFNAISNGTIVVHNFKNNSQTANYAWLELMKSTFASVYEDWIYIEKITTFFKKSFYTVCFVNPACKSTVIFVENLNIRKLHYLQCATFPLLPYYFDAEAGFSDLEMELIYSFREKNSKNFTEVMEKYSKQFDFRKMSISRLKGFEVQFEKNERDRVFRDLDAKRRAIDEANAKVANLINQSRDLEIRLMGLDYKLNENSESSELMDYFLKNTRLNLGSVDGTSMVFTVRDYLVFYDKGLVKRTIKNKNSYIYQPNGRTYDTISADDMEMLMTAIFVNEELKIRTCAAYSFDLNGNVSAYQYYNFDASFNDCIPNTHINRYRCMGDYPSKINACLATHDYIGALELCAASCRSFNFGDSTVLGAFMTYIYTDEGCNTRCIELPNGEVVKAKEAIKWLKANKESVENE